MPYALPISRKYPFTLLPQLTLFLFKKILLLFTLDLCLFRSKKLNVLDQLSKMSSYLVKGVLGGVLRLVMELVRLAWHITTHRALSAFFGLQRFCKHHSFVITLLIEKGLDKRMQLTRGFCRRGNLLAFI